MKDSMEELYVAFIFLLNKVLSIFQHFKKYSTLCPSVPCPRGFSKSIPAGFELDGG